MCEGRYTEHFAWSSWILGMAFCRGQGIGPQEKLLHASPPACEMGRDDGNDRIVSEQYVIMSDVQWQGETTAI